MRELRIFLPNELWEKFQNQSPQQMKAAIATIICLQFQVCPEPKKRKPTLSTNLQRGNAGRFVKNTTSNAQLSEMKLSDHNGAAAHEPKQKLEPETQRENMVQEPESPINNSNPEAETLPKKLHESKTVITKSGLKIHPAFAIGLKP